MSGSIGAGEAYVFDVDPLSPTFGNLIHTLSDPNPIFADHFGETIATAGDRILIGTRGNGGTPGAVYLFDGQLGSASLGDLLLTITDIPNLDGFTTAPAIDFLGDDILIGVEIHLGLTAWCTCMMAIH